MTSFSHLASAMVAILFPTRQCLQCSPHFFAPLASWIEFTSADGKVTAIADSNAIFDFLSREFNVQSSLSAADAVTAHLLTRTLDEHVYWTIVRARWVSTKSAAFLADNYFGSSQLFASFVIWAAGMRGNLWAQGTGRFSEEEIVARLEADCAVISELLKGRGTHHPACNHLSIDHRHPFHTFHAH